MRNINFQFFFLLLFLIAIVGALDVSNVLLKITAHPNDQISKNLIVSSDTGGETIILSKGINNTRISESRVVLMKGERREIQVVFDFKGVEEGVYVGSIDISQAGEVSIIPVVEEVESEEVFYDVNLDIPPQYSTISPGDKLLAQIKVYDLTSGGTTDGLGSERVTIDYTVFDLQGNIVSSEIETIAVDKQTQLTKSISFPENFGDRGTYVLSAIVRYKNSVGASSSLFNIQEAPGSLSFSGANSKFYIIVIAIFLAFTALIFLFVYIIKDRDKLVLELKRQNDEELSEQRKLLIEQEKVLIDKFKSGKIKANEVSGKDVSSKNDLDEYKKKVRRDMDRKMIMLKGKQIEREKEFRKLKTRGNVNELKRQLEVWKKQGYNTTPLEYKLDDLSEGEMRKILAGWKKKYSTEEYKNENHD